MLINMVPGAVRARGMMAATRPRCDGAARNLFRNKKCQYRRIAGGGLRPCQCSRNKADTNNPKENTAMKTILALVAAALTLGVVTPATAEARPGRSSSTRVAYHCDHCGSPVYKVRYIAFYHRDGCPEYRWRTVSHYCRARHHRGHDHGHGHGHRH